MPFSIQVTDHGGGPVPPASDIRFDGDNELGTGLRVRPGVMVDAAGQIIEVNNLLHDPRHEVVGQSNHLAGSDGYRLIRRRGPQATLKRLKAAGEHTNQFVMAPR